MRNSASSRNKYQPNNNINSNMKTQGYSSSYSQQQQRLMRTDNHNTNQQIIKGNQLQRTGRIASSNKKIDSQKNIGSTKQQGPVVKKQFNIQQNMTNSRIIQAKQGLTLLKKKMSNRGNSRQRTDQPSSSNNITTNAYNKNDRPQIPTMKKQSSINSNNNLQQPLSGTLKNKKIQSNIISNYNTNSTNNQKIRSSYTTKNSLNNQQPVSPYGINSKSKIGNSSNNNNNKNLINNNTSNLKNNNIRNSNNNYQQQSNYMVQRPIPQTKQKKDFNQILQEQLRKQQNKNNNNYDEYQNQNFQLVQCRHCSRKFGQNAIQKHQKICVKVFLQKRKAFDSSQQRGPDGQTLQSQTNIGSKFGNKKPNSQLNKTTKPPAKKQQMINGMPKWKAQSIAFRASMKQAKGQQLSNQQLALTAKAQDAGLVPCNYCGRKFAQKAAQRHIPFCQTKSKQIPKNNNIKKR